MKANLERVPRERPERANLERASATDGRRRRTSFRNGLCSFRKQRKQVINTGDFKIEIGSGPEIICEVSHTSGAHFGPVLRLF